MLKLILWYHTTLMIRGSPGPHAAFSISNGAFPPMLSGGVTQQSRYIGNVLPLVEPFMVPTGFKHL